MSILLLFITTYSNLEFRTALTSDMIANPVVQEDPIIVIDDDSDFSIYPGYGNETHPYIIEGLTIIAGDSEIGVNITGTTKHFVLRNNDIKSDMGALGLVGIYLYNVTSNTATIENNYITGFAIVIYAEMTTGLTIENNALKRPSGSKLGVTGIYLVQCPFAYIRNNALYDGNVPVFKEPYSSEPTLNAIEGGKWFGVYMSYCSDSEFIGNSIDLEGFHIIALAGLYISDSDRILIETNDIRNVRMEETQYEAFEHGGISLEGVNNVTIFNNTVEYTEKRSLQIAGCTNLLISNNTFGYVETTGISIDNSINSIVIYNTIQHCPSYAIDIDEDSSNHTIHHNHFIDNIPSGPSQASDYGINNVWYDTVTEEGNWWIGDWYGGPYVITGTAGSSDPYPLGEPLTIPEFSTKIIALILFMSLSIAIVPIFKKRGIS